MTINRSRTIKVANGASVSDVVDANDTELVGFILPASIDSATKLTFKVCATVDGTFVNLYDDAGNEVEMTVAAARAVAASTKAAMLAPWAFFQIRLGTAASPVVATADRSIVVCTKS